MQIQWSGHALHVSKWYLNMAGAIVLGLCLLALTPTGAAAHGPACRGSSCRGQDPVAMGCGRDAVTIATIPHPGTASAGYLEVTELRWSARCRASWARVTSRLTATSIQWTTAWISGHYSATRLRRYGAAGSLVWSRMWSGAVTACGVSIDKHDPSYIVAACAP